MQIHVLYIYVYIPLKISQIGVSNIRCGKHEDNIRTSSQNISFISYQRDRTPLNAITPDFITETCGIPQRGTRLPDRSVESLFQYALFCHEFKKHEG
ncbi:MAG: hypothetical protein ACKPKO_18095, partial [Candidatus Fonsibacter sp.]